MKKFLFFFSSKLPKRSRAPFSDFQNNVHTVYSEQATSFYPSGFTSPAHAVPRQVLVLDPPLGHGCSPSPWLICPQILFVPHLPLLCSGISDMIPATCVVGTQLSSGWIQETGCPGRSLANKRMKEESEAIFPPLSTSRSTQRGLHILRSSSGSKKL